MKLGNGNAQEAASAAWADSWHMRGKLMVCKGEVDAAGAVRLVGTYEAPSGPDWGSRIDILPVDSGALRTAMFNVPPANW